MYLEHLHLTRPPFQEEPDPTCFFPGAGRKALLQALFQDFQENRPLIKVIGREGSGKTLICQVFIRWLPNEYEVISLDNPIGDFDDLMRLTCLDLGMDSTHAQNAVDYSQELQRLLQYKREVGKKVILLIDEAEKLFMAALERLVRIPTELPKDSGLSIILVGRPGLDVNLEHLSAFCDDIDTLVEYELPDLTLEETISYLSFRMQAAGLKDAAQFNKIFPESTVSKMYEIAKGNIRMINILAEESLQVSFSQKSFMVLLDKVAPETEPRSQYRKKSPLPDKDSSLPRKRIVMGAAACLLLAILAFFLVPGTKNQPAIAPQNETNITDETQDRTGIISIQNDLLSDQNTDSQSFETSPLTEETVVDIQNDEDKVSADPAEWMTDTEEPIETDQQQGSVAKGETGEETKSMEVPSSQESELLNDTGKAYQLGAISPSLGHLSSNAAEAMETSPYPDEYTEPLDSSVEFLNTPDETPPQTSILPLQGRKAVTLAMPKSLSGADIVRERQQAGAAWLKQARENAYTLQIMHLSSPQAEDRLAELLMEKDYYPLRNQFYILQKTDTSQGFFLFYGIYEGKEAAREAQEALPSFLQSYRPYPLRISEAVKKIK